MSANALPQYEDTEARQLLADHLEEHAPDEEARTASAARLFESVVKIFQTANGCRVEKIAANVVRIRRLGGGHVEADLMHDRGLLKARPNVRWGKLTVIEELRLNRLTELLEGPASGSPPTRKAGTLVVMKAIISAFDECEVDPEERRLRNSEALSEAFSGRSRRI